MNDSKKLINPKITPEIQAMIDSDDPGCGKVYTTNLCIMRHRAAKIKESKGLEHGPCAYCLLILKYLAEEKQNKKEITKMETKKANEKPLKPGKPGTLSFCVECRECRKIATSGVCWSCYAKPEVKKKYGIGQYLKRTTENTSEAPKAKQPEAVVAPAGTVELVVDGKSLPAADTIHAKSVGDTKIPEIKTSESKRPDKLTRADLLELHTSLTETAKALMTRKNADYGATSDPFANFRMSALLHISPETGVLLRLQDKMARLVSFIEKGELKVTEESWRDSIIDIINYSVLLCGLLQEKTGKEA